MRNFWIFFIHALRGWLDSDEHWINPTILFFYFWNLPLRGILKMYETGRILWNMEGCCGISNNIVEWGRSNIFFHISYMWRNIFIWNVNWGTLYIYLQHMCVVRSRHVDEISISFHKTWILKYLSTKNPVLKCKNRKIAPSCDSYW